MLKSKKCSDASLEEFDGLIGSANSWNIKMSVDVNLVEGYNIFKQSELNVTIQVESGWILAIYSESFPSLVISHETNSIKDLVIDSY
jgi:hypothetical protein